MADQLELLFQALVRRVRDVRPEHLSRPFEVADILRTFVPYRTTRTEVGVETAEDYEVLVLRLLSGERGFVFADDAMQDDLRRELDSGNPDLRALHAYGTARVTLAQHAMRQVLEASVAAAQRPVPAAGGVSPTSVTAGEPSAELTGAQPAETAAKPAPMPAAEHPAPAEPAEHAVLRDAEGRVVATLGREAIVRAPDAAEVAAALDALQRTLPPTLAELGEMMGPAADAKARAPFHARAARIPDPTADTAARTPRPGCRFCGQMLPEGREVTFCPHCGQNLRVRRCPGCSAEIEPTWKFCVTCGRASASS